MKKTLLFLMFIIAFNFQSISQKDYSDDTKSIDAIMTATYDAISGEKGEKRDWDRFINLFIEEARLMPTMVKEGQKEVRIMTPQSYVETSGAWLEENGFHEVEINRRVERYGSLAHVWSTYESYRSKNDEKPFARGINSFQLIHNGEEWKVVQIYWLGEREDKPIPPYYLPE